MRVSRAEFQRILRLRAEKKAKRAEKAKALWGKKTRRKPSARKTAFKALKAARDMFVRLRGKHRNGGLCEVAMNCGGASPAEVVYHVFPAAMGNAIKHDHRNLLMACSRCNGAEYFARKRGASEPFHNRHRAILGVTLWNELKAAQGRKQISTAEVREMTDRYNRMTEAGEWRS